MIGWLLEQLRTNEVFSGIVGGGVIMSFVSAGLYLLRRVPIHLQNFLQRQLSVQLTVHSNSETFVWIQQWIAEQSFTADSRRLQLDRNRHRKEEESGGWMTTLGEGNHFFRHRGHFFRMHHEVIQTDAGREPKRTITFETFGRSRQPLLNIAKEASELRYQIGDVQQVHVWDHYWRLIRGRRHRSINTVFLPAGLKQSVCDDIRWYLGAADWYAERGVPYRRGYLFSGPPGTGKTSLVAALASYFRRVVYALNLAMVDDDSDLQEAFWSVGPNSILLVEDIDAMVVKRDAGEATTNKPVSLSGFLNAIDGVMAPDGQLLLMTTNYPDRLDDALMRPGRVDRRIDFGEIEQMVAQEMFKSFYPASKLVLPDVKMTPAELQAVFLGNPDNAEDAMGALR